MSEEIRATGCFYAHPWAETVSKRLWIALGHRKFVEPVEMRKVMSELVSWERPYFEPGGGDAELFYVVFVDPPTEWAISRSTYRCAGIPDGLQLGGYGPGTHPDVVDGFRTGPIWEQARAQVADLVPEIEAAQSCVVLRGNVGDQTTLDYHRDVVGALKLLCDQGAVAILDMFSISWWRPEDWTARAFAVEKPAPKSHVILWVTEEPSGTLWLHTRGMLKYGRPDIGLRNVPKHRQEDAAHLVNRFIEMLAFGAIVPDGQAIRVNGLPDGMTTQTLGGPEDVEFNNRHIAIEWPKEA